ncbi:MAG: MBL fold metallo-hydrolase [Candidatus Hodarchaeota archaeon]
MLELIFLGTGGGRIVMTTQMRWTGGIVLRGNDTQIHIDPGPGALIRALDLGINPQKTEVIIVTHTHLDHYGDCQILMEAMAGGATKKGGVLLGSSSALIGDEQYSRIISKYHEGLLKEKRVLTPGSSFSIEGIKITATPAYHSDPSTFGLIIEEEENGARIGYTSDTAYNQSLPIFYKNCELFILCCLRPFGKPWEGHLSTDEAIPFVEEVKPSLTVLTHFGAAFLKANPEKQAKIVEEKTGIKTIAATDGMSIKLEEKEIFLKEKTSTKEEKKLVKKKGAIASQLTDFYSKK